MPIDLIQQMDRRVHTASSGIEIQRKFYFEPYSAFPEVLEALQGKVVADANGVFTRTLPAKDPYITNCFCNEARVDFADADAMATSPTLDLPRNEAGEEASLLDKIQTVFESTPTGAAGGVVTATYRPLITALTDPEHENAFDWIDPQFTTSLRQVPWPDGLFVATGGAVILNKPVPKELGSPIHIPVHEFTIRRVLVGQPDWNGIKAAAGKVNIFAFPEDGVSTTLPTFPPGTLKFDSAQVENRLSPDGSRWFELTYTFLWLDYEDNPVFDENGLELGGHQPVTWNHVLMRPTFAGFGVNKMGWYFVGKQQAVEFFDIGNPFVVRQTAGPLFSLTTFGHLFL